MNILATKWLKQVPLSVGYYLSGFVDGEGSFNVSLRRRNDHTLGWQIVLTFNVSQKDKTVLEILKKHLGCGRLQKRKLDGVWYFVVSNPQALSERVIPFFNQFGFLSTTKKRNFSIFKQIVEMVITNQHCSAEGTRKIIELRETLNEGRGRKRKFSLSDYQKYLSDNPQRLYVRIHPRAKRVNKI